MMIHALTFEYSYSDNHDGDPSPDEAGGIIALFEDPADAQRELEKQQDDGHYGDFSDADSNGGWSSGGYILAVTPMPLIRSSNR
jgi:hypothetical protein